MITNTVTFAKTSLSTINLAVTANMVSSDGSLVDPVACKSDLEGLGGISLRKFENVEEMRSQICTDFENLNVGDEFVVPSHATYIIDAIDRDLSTYSLTRVVNEKLYSPNEDVVISANGMRGKGQVVVDGGKYWYAVDFGENFKFTRKENMHESDCIHKVVMSESERCYYICTTEGLYRSWNDDLSDCERVLKDEIKIGDAVRNAHVMDMCEIGFKLYMLTLTGFTAGNGYIVLYSAETDKVQKKQIASGWPYSFLKLSQDSSDQYEIFVTNADSAVYGSVISVMLSADGTYYIDDQVRNIYAKAGTVANSSQYILSSGTGRVFTSRHYSENPGGATHTFGVDWWNGASLSSGVSQVQTNTIPELSASRIFQLRMTNDRIFACTGLSTPGSDFGLYEINETDGSVGCVSLSADPYLSGHTKAKDIIYSSKANKWMFIMDDYIYVSNGDETGNWTQLTSTGLSVSEPWLSGNCSSKETNAFPLFSEFTDYIMTNSIRLNDDLSSTTPTALVTQTAGGGFLATLDDIKLRNIRVDDHVVDPDEHGFVDINVKDALGEMIVVCDELPAVMKDGCIYLVKKQ